ncbi:ABC transporter ATP-binding protein/permease [Georgenia satyanarayanai]|uniref:ABC transporter ATP-binding protein n=1 Tax=Georgenia satyanarayanai TaxID=860221 RepID=UPI0020407203|nr:ABC transporter ATP-binding protein [Georgenia satyanarayanai]MCM3662049.1 ABC transporter ATP-binding protein/permease [Georgenia satyanarayanai]
MLLTLLRRHLRPYRRDVVVVVLLQFVQTLAALSLPSLNADIIDKGVVVGDTGYIMRVGALMLLISAVQVACAVSAVYLGARAATSVGRDLRRAVFTRVQRFSVAEAGRFGAPSLITRSTNDVQQVQMVTLMTFTVIVMAPIMMVGGVVMALRQDVGLSALLLVVVPVLLGLIVVIALRMGPLFKLIQGRIDRINLVMREQISGVRVIRAFNRQPSERQRFGRANSELMGTSLSVGYLMALMFPAVQVVINASSVAVVWFGAGRIDSGAMEVGSLVAFLNYLMQILMSVLMASMMFMMVPRAAVSADRIEAVLGTEPAIVAPARPRRLPAGRAVIELDGVSFGYAGAAASVLHDVSLRLEPGRTTAIIGSTGSGKSTLVNLLPRLVDATGGVVRAGGVDVREVDPAELRSRVSVVPQRAYLFSGTIASTLRFARPEATDEELWGALEAAQASEFVTGLGLDARVEQGGSNFSGGQRQRLAIARALLKPADLYVFDDSFSALDYATDARLRAGLPMATAGAAVLIVAQRVATIREADEIVVLDEGRVVGRGSHSGLMEDNPTYQEIVLSQLSAQEAA